MSKKTVRKKKTTPRPVPTSLYVTCMVLCIPVALLMIPIEPVFSALLLFLLILLSCSFLSSRNRKKSTKKSSVPHQKTHPITDHPAPRQIPETPDNIAPDPELSKIDVSQFLDKTERFHVTGVSHYISSIDDLAIDNPDYDLTKTEMIDEALEEERIYEYEFSPNNVQLIEEPDNQYDPNAIKVIIDGFLVGYIKKGSCAHVRKLLRSGKIRDISASITGGKYKYLYSKYDYDKDKDVYDIERGKRDYHITIEVTYPE